MTTVVGSLEVMVTRLDPATRRKLAEFEGLEPGQLEGKKIEVDAAALLELVKAHVAVDEVKTKREAAAAAAKAAASQQELSMAGDGPSEAGAADVAAGEGDDELLDEAAEIVRAEGRASISLVQRKLRIGYNRAARLLESLEAKGVVTPMDGKGERKVIG
ncbi:DNA translocase FtsK [Aeromonas veronii]|uniref:DNA translocase FtsK n=1 Tax=Aeromonas veronii TaxID=654 RepID=UPI003C6BFA37